MTAVGTGISAPARAETTKSIQVKFLRGGSEVVSLIGTVIERESDYDSFTTRPDESGSRILSEIAFSKVTLVLTPPETPVAE